MNWKIESINQKMHKIQKKIEIDLSKMNDLIPKHELKLNLLQSQLENLDQKIAINHQFVNQHIDSI